MLADGWKLECLQDDADYVARFEKLRKGELDFAVATVDTDILAGMRTGFPGVAVFVIDVSVGADAVLARKDVVADLTSLRAKTDLKVAYAPNTPSDYLRKMVGVHFDVPLLRSQDKSLRVETKGSAEACDKLVKGEVQVAVCWEPDVSNALSKPGIIKLLGSEQTSRAIVDVLLVRQEYADRYPENVKLFVGNYFKTLKHYQDDLDLLRHELAGYAKVSEPVADEIIKGISWVNLYDNATVWMGVAGAGQVPSYALIETIESTLKVLKDKDIGDLSSNPLPSEDPRRIINSEFVRALFGEGVAPTASSGAVATSSLEKQFSPLDEGGWKNLREIGTLKVRPILFQSGANQLDLEDKEQLDEAVESLKVYPNFRIEVQGHTKPGGDAAADKTLSQERAEAVGRYLQVTYNIDPNRLHIVGVGSKKPLSQQAGEPYRAYRDRLARVEIHLKTEVY
jgi:outer membrane protein OmpA-like peptidoglycan-associated protein